ncbi:unnamed protein product [Microthlaspi erraticum]|uniref:Uncharacterized protein n=1 Tax=Microthlaspi erraticum TaxID=1685480 RepID=A0A6D2JXQ0_9BRAS|nr:unnamed protein product [Microthlaspi erraticum]
MFFMTLEPLCSHPTKETPGSGTPRASSFEPREAEASRQRRIRSSRTRRSDLTDGLDRAQAEHPELDRARDRVDPEEPPFEHPAYEVEQAPCQDLYHSHSNPYSQFERSRLSQGQGSHTYFNDDDEGCMDEAASSAPDGRLPSLTQDLASQFFGEH